MHFSQAAITVCSMLLFCHAGASPYPLLEQLRNDHATLLGAERDFQHRRNQGLLNAAESADYGAWIAQLRERVRQDCIRLAMADRPLPADLPCPTTSVSVTRPAPAELEAEKTASEMTMALDGELEAGLAEFDELLLREQERVKASRPPSAETGGGSAGGETDGDGTEPGAAGGTGSGSAADGELTGTGSTTPDGARGGPGTASRKGSSGQPPDIPDGSDDDVVARQLREAAEKETDPELKKKLWDEYRKYKKGTG
jgi:hypothetical protein